MQVNIPIFLNHQPKKGLNQWCLWSSLKHFSAYLLFKINLITMAWIFKKKWKWRQTELLIFDEKSAIFEKTHATSNFYKRQTTWPKWLKFWYKKCQSLLFKTWLISNPCLLAWRSKSLTESDNSVDDPVRFFFGVVIRSGV